MNNTEIEMILQELLRDVQTIKLEIKQTSNAPKQENENYVNRQLESILKEMGYLKDSVNIVAQKTSPDVPKIDYTPIFKFEEKLKELKRIQSLPPHAQIVSHEHSFKNWKWLLVLFLFMGSTVVLGWYALHNYYLSREYSIKHSFTQKMMPRFTQWMDSLYMVNPALMQSYQIPETKKTKAKAKKKQKKVGLHKDVL